MVVAQTWAQVELLALLPVQQQMVMVEIWGCVLVHRAPRAALYFCLAVSVMPGLVAILRLHQLTVVLGAPAVQFL